MTVFKAPEYIQNLFNTIAKKYDLLNNAMSFGLHKIIKKDCIKLLDLKEGANVLDGCCGTGDMAEFVKEIQPLAEVTGVDFSENMLSIAQKKVKNVHFMKKDITSTDFPDNSFDAVIMGFGLRNISNPERALSEILRILKPGGKFLHLDFGRKNFASSLFNLIIPVSAFIFGGNFKSYSYLIKSKNAFPEPEELISDFEKSGFIFVKRKDYLFRVISTQILKK